MRILVLVVSLIALGGCGKDEFKPAPKTPPRPAMAPFNGACMEYCVAGNLEVIEEGRHHTCNRKWVTLFVVLSRDEVWWYSETNGWEKANSYSDWRIEWDDGGMVWEFNYRSDYNDEVEEERKQRLGREERENEEERI